MGKSGHAAKVAEQGGRRLTLTETKDSPKGILVSKLSDDAMIGYAAEHAVEGFDGGSAEQKATALHAHFQAAGSADVVCQECWGEYPDSHGSCPFCGDGEEEEEAAAGAVAVVLEEAGDEEDDAEEGPGEDDEGDDDEALPPAASKDIVVHSALAGAPAKGAALAVVEGGKGGSKLKEKDLDKAIGEVIRLKGSAGGAYWDLGDAIRDIHERQLWKLRPGADGRPQRYKSFEAFCLAELGMQPMSALSAKDLATRYPREIAEKYGRSKMTFLVRADDMDRPLLEAAVKGGATKAQLAKKAKELKAGKPVVQRDGVVRAPPAATRPPNTSKPLAGDRITVAALLDKPIMVAAYKKPAGKLSQLSDPKALARARKLADDPVGRYELPNGKVLYLAMDATPAGELRFRLKFVSEDAAAEEK